MRDKLRTIKWAWQRVVRGYDDRLYWAMDEYLDPIILAGLRNLRENGHGYPSGLTEKKWNQILDKMMVAFELDKYSVNRKNHIKRKDGMALFAFYYDNLWD